MNYSIISKYRTQIMAIATLWIGILHARMYFPIPWINAIKLTGQSGVDIFLLLSGFGMTYALSKKRPLSIFYYQRFIRIIPSFIGAALVLARIYHYDIPTTLKLLSMLNIFLTGSRTMWFVTIIVLLYLVSPLYYSLFRKNEVVVTIITVLITLAFSFLFMNGDYIVFFARIPIFFLGFLLGDFSMKKREISTRELIVNVLMFFIGIVILKYSFRLGDDFLWGYGMFWYPTLLFGWPMCLLISIFFSYLDKIKLNSFVSVVGNIGKISFEFYLWQEIFIYIAEKVVTINPPYNYYGILLQTMVILFTLGWAWCYQKVIASMISFLEKKWGKEHERV